MDHPIATAIITFPLCRVVTLHPAAVSRAGLWARPQGVLGLAGGAQHPRPSLPVQPLPRAPRALSYELPLLRILYRPLSTPVCYGEGAGRGGVQKNRVGGGFSRQPAHGKGHPCASSVPPRPVPCLAPLHVFPPPRPGVHEPGSDPRMLPGAEPGAGLGAVGAPPPAPTPNPPKASSPGDLALNMLMEPCRGWGRDLQPPWVGALGFPPGLPPGMLCPNPVPKSMLLPPLCACMG